MAKTRAAASFVSESIREVPLERKKAFPSTQKDLVQVARSFFLSHWPSAGLRPGGQKDQYVAVQLKTSVAL